MPPSLRKSDHLQTLILALCQTVWHIAEVSQISNIFFFPPKKITHTRSISKPIIKFITYSYFQQNGTNVRNTPNGFVTLEGVHTRSEKEPRVLGYKHDSSKKRVNISRERKKERRKKERKPIQCLTYHPHNQRYCGALTGTNTLFVQQLRQCPGLRTSISSL